MKTAAHLSDQLLGLSERLQRQTGFDDVVAALAAGHAATLDGVWGSSCALVAAALLGDRPTTLVLVTPTAEHADTLADDLGLFTRVTPERLPAHESLPREQVLHDEVFGERIRVLKLLGGDQPPRLLLASIQSLVQPVPTADTLAARSRLLRVGHSSDPDQLARWLAESGFHGTTAVELPGEFSVRGGIVDIFAPDWSDPVRVEFFGDEVESLRRFDVASQRSLANFDRVQVTALDPSDAVGAHLSDYLPDDAWLMLIEPDELREQGGRYLERLEAPDHFHSVDQVMRQLTRRPTVTASALAASSMETTCRLNIESVERFSGDISRVRDELDGLAVADPSAAGPDQCVYVVCQTEAEAERLGELLSPTQLAKDGRLHFPIGMLESGFRLVSEGIVLLSSNELFRRDEVRRPVRRHVGRAIDSFLELRPGDLVVHVAHGIARYRGMKLLESANDGRAMAASGHAGEEHLELEFHGGTKLYVPSSKISLVQKYVGGAKSRPTLARLGGKTWVRQKARVQQAVTDMAADMLQLQAAREARPGIGFPTDTQWQREFDASFPYSETPDQLTTLRAIKGDMTRPRPMDRLLCGDVGYGKTEVAMRAAFKAVDAGYQVAVLVPTTVLAEQHGRTFNARMAEFPFEIATLSRFATRKEQSQVVARLADGTVDIVIGTHRLAQKDVQFSNLGLVIIDEEQRFGVEVKERLKALRHTVDVLTMTATPIPRTLHMGLLGVRDISNLETPPEDRLAVETRVTRFNAELIRHAVMREMGRGGQVFFVHNRVQDIHAARRRLEEIVPEARIGIGHGQMPEHELEDVMLDFVAGRFDILLATTIVESGLDIPNANTIFIDEADRYGLADLHQLRGRVGRYKHRAYCYLLVDPKKHLSPNSARRLRAIEEFSDMGAGFAIAMRDLEIRGAGNILGTEQSGHIAVVGYELYCSLLEEAVRRLKRLPPKKTVDVDIDLPIAAYIPPSYVPDMRAKIDLYRRLAAITTGDRLDDLREELSDRFGPPPLAVERLLDLSEIRVLAHGWQIGSIHREDSYAVLGYASPERIRRLADLSVQRTGRMTTAGLRIVDGRTAYLPLAEQVSNGEQLLPVLKSLLQP